MSLAYESGASLKDVAPLLCVGFGTCDLCFAPSVYHILYKTLTFPKFIICFLSSRLNEVRKVCLILHPSFF